MTNDSSTREPNGSPTQESGDAPAGQPLTSLSEVHGSVAVPRHHSFWKRLFAFVGPAYLVSVGYMDPGNWATDIAAGSRYGYALIWVLVMSNIMAILLQGMSARVGIVTGMDLAQACRAMFGRPASVALWLLAELAIAATDLAEVLGSAIGLKLLFGVPLTVGVLLTVLDTFLLLVLHSMGMRVMEAFIVVLVTTIGVCLGTEIVLARPDLSAIAAGFLPSLPGSDALYLAIGILGATVMPHNLYLHSALVQSRSITQTAASIRGAVRFNFIDSVVALNGAFFVNAALLAMAAATFHRTGRVGVADIQEAHALLQPILGASLAPIAFAVALIAAGQASTITGTLAGQIVMEGFVRLRLRPVVRRLITRAVAIVPAIVAIVVLGEEVSGKLLVLSQVILSLQLSFAVIPLVHLVSDRRWMGAYAVGVPTQILGWIVAAIIVSLNFKLAVQEVSSWASSAGSASSLVTLLAGAMGLGLLMLLAYVTVLPALQRRRGAATPEQVGVHGQLAMPEIMAAAIPQRLAAAVDFSDADQAVLSQTLTLARAAGRGATVLLLHVVESGGARVMGQEMGDSEARADQARLDLYCSELINMGIDARWALGYGDPPEALARLVAQHAPQLLVMGAHGHGLVGDLVHGTTVDKLRHRISVPLLVVPAKGDADNAAKPSSQP